MNNDYIAHYGNTAGSTIFESAVKNESIWKTLEEEQICPSS